MRVCLYIFILFTHIRPSYWHQSQIRSNFVHHRVHPQWTFSTEFLSSIDLLGSGPETSFSARWIRSVERSEDASTRPVGVVASRCQRRAWTLRLRRSPWSRRRSLNRRERIAWPMCPCPRWHPIRIIVRPNTDHPVHRGHRIHLALCSIRIIARRDLTGRHARYWFSSQLLKFALLFSSTSQSVWRAGFNTILRRLLLAG